MRENKYVRDSLRFFFGAFVLVLLYSCANMATPNGGPYDEAPPKFVSSDPLPNQLNFKKNRVEILFDELVQLDQPSENVIVTPPQRLQPVIQANGRRVIVEFQDTMLENETYTIDFTTALADNNEKTVLENFTFALCTGWKSGFSSRFSCSRSIPITRRAMGTEAVRPGDSMPMS